MAETPMIDSMKRGLERFAERSDQPSWLSSLRETGARDFGQLGLPGTRDEAWKYTSTAALARQEFEPVLADEVRYEEPAIAEVIDRVAGELGGPVFVFVDGNFVAGLSRLPDADATPGVQVSSLRSILGQDPGSLEPFLGHYLEARVHGLAALNTAFLDDGLVVRVARGVVVPRPLSVVFWTTSRQTPVAAHPRNLIVAEPGSSVTVVEHYAGTGTYLCNTVTEVAVQDNAVVNHVTVVEDSSEGFHVGRIDAEVARDARFRSHAIALTGKLNRTEIHARLVGENSEAVLRGLYCLDGKDHADHHTSVDHVVAHTRSSEMYKGVLDGRSRGVFTGRIVIRPNAQKVSSEQTNNNLLISDEAVVETRPQLEIYADDVKASHGATIGRLDSEKLFYMRARGLDEREAKRLLTYAFAGEPVEDIEDEPLRDALSAAIRRKVECLHTDRARTGSAHSETGDRR
ncbi:MAG: Fe-S cluster assembly protein SufD [Hyphomicrobiaceae bacterium]|jgi:Fe-S cluster assembly protein SufD